jgi:hypothetical protein
MAYNINITWEPLSKGLFYIVLKALYLKTNNIKGLNFY